MAVELTLTQTDTQTDTEIYRHPYLDSYVFSQKPNRYVWTSNSSTSRWIEGVIVIISNTEKDLYTLSENMSK